MYGPTATAATAEVVRGKSFSGLLGRTVVGRAEALAGRSYAALLLEDGAAELSDAGGTFAIAAPSLSWKRWTPDMRLSISPAATGAYILTGATPLGNAIGHKPELAELGQLVERRLILRLGARPELAETARAAIRGMLAEQADGAPAARTVIEAHLGILLVALWRAAEPGTSAGPARSPAEKIFHRFNGLVELHFRDRWTVAAYAAALGVSRDRLGDICQRCSGRSPRNLVTGRLVFEARHLLEQSTLSVEQVASLLGFPAASHFSRFFRRQTGLAPGRYRQERARRFSLPPATGLHAWP